MLQSQKRTSSQSESSSEKPFLVAPPAVTLPKGGGAIKGIGEKFAANPVTGTGSMTVPIATSPGRSGFGPQLSLSYDSGAGNGPFGFGWSLSLPSITRKTDKGLPRYEDATESDVFILSGAEDLVPVLVQKKPGEWIPESLPDRTVSGKTYAIKRYRPRIEGLFARIERWTNVADAADVHWRSISKDNILTLYGKDAKSRIFDPEDPRRIFSWLICETRDDKGNGVLYDYKPEDSAGVDLGLAHELNRGDRTDSRRTANRYLKHIYYGNRTPLLDATGHRPRFLTQAEIDNAGWMFEVVFDYDEHGTNAPTPSETREWSYRQDPFSTYRAGFEVRTTRLCQRVLMFHHFPGEKEPDGTEVGKNCLVRSTDFTYSYEQKPKDARNPIYSFLLSVTQTGYKRNPAGGYIQKSLPPLEFTYSEPNIDETVREVDPVSLENLPQGLDGVRYQWVDLDGEGLSGILTEQGGGWFYKRNLSPINEVKNKDNGKTHVEANFAPVERVASKPNLALAGGQGQFMDLAGDGQPDLVTFRGVTPGFYERTQEAGWENFVAFKSLPNLDWDNPNLKFIDLNGDGHSDILITEDNCFVWHPSLAEDGFDAAERVYQPWDEEKGPRVIFADSTQSIHLADLSGDGLTDIVRIRNGEVCYWPNLGYGRFGAKVTMDNAPWFDRPDIFNQRRIVLADIDGSGTTDILYLSGEGVQVYFNQSGNGWSAKRVLRGFPAIDSVASVTAIDLLGNGTACLVWSSPLPGNGRRVMRYIDLMGGQKPQIDGQKLQQKPHLLIKVVNNLGAETHVQYAPSTKFYLQDKYDGKPWITRLPFPVHVVERVEIYDRISGNRFVTRYAYHHGYFDGEEREFRGFGMVEQWDTEEIGTIQPGDTTSESTNLDAASFVPPVHTKTWFHNGAYIAQDKISHLFTHEYYQGDAQATLLPDTVLPTGLTVEEEREACRALKGSMLRQEVYALDGTDKAKHPYTVTEQNFTIAVLQRRGDNRYGVFFTHAREVINYHYERNRNPADPRIQQALTLEVDRYGNVLKSVAIAYGRRFDAPDLLLLPEDRDKQRLIHITYTENFITKELDDVVVYPDDYRTPLPAETCTYELRKPQQEKSGNELTQLYRFDTLLSHTQQAGDGNHDIDYEDYFFERAQQAVANNASEGKNYFRRLIERVRTLYRPDDLGAAKNDPLALLALGTVQPLALPGETYKLAFTPGLLTKVYKRPLDVVQPPGAPLPENLLTDSANVLGGKGGDLGGYVDLDNNGHWWIPSGRMFYSPGSADTAAQELAYARQSFFLPHRYRDPFHTDAVKTESFVTYDSYPLLVLETRDALTNTVTVGNDYRVLQPRLVTDPNRNRTAVAFNALGMVVATAVMGKTVENLGDLPEDFDADPPLASLQAFVADPQAQAASLLGKATTRIVYDLDRYQRAGQPPFAVTLARETHFHPGGAQTRIQIGFSYSDGFGREIQKKIQAEAGDAPQRQAPVPLAGGDIRPGELVLDGQGKLVQANTLHRWVGSGRAVFNNKGKPVRQYEPFFSATHLYEPEREMTDTGVSLVLFYDPVERVVATLHPNHTYEKVVFDPWQQVNYDVNDTVAAQGAETGDPRTDPDIQGYVSRYFATQPAAWQTWYAQRQGGALGPQEQAAANKAAAHANTPTTAYFDTLGRAFLIVAHNKVVCNGHALDGTEAKFCTRVELDIEGNRRSVRDAIEQNGDAQGRIVMRYDYDLLGNRIHQASMEAGERWMLNDVVGNPIRAWDSRGFNRLMTYDELRRPTGLYVIENGAKRLAEQTIYGEGQGDAANHRTRVYQVCDGAGMATNVAYDFKGNLEESQRELLRDYKTAVDWQQNPLANGIDGSFTSSTQFDALNRPTSVTSPDGSVYRPTFNEANLLDKVEVNLRGAPAATLFVANINYNAKGQRELIEYGCGAAPNQQGVTTIYEYDKDTFRLIHLKTTRPAGLNGLSSQIFATPTVVQDLRYTYDPAGNITRIADGALKTIFHNNEQVEPVCSYTYDAIYRLIEAKGREHIGQTAHDFNNGNRRDYPFTGLSDFIAHPNDTEKLRNYTERYEYDAVGNSEVMLHKATKGDWTRTYEYLEPSLLEANKKSNRLTRTTLGNGFNYTETYTYTDLQGNDVHGCMTAINSMNMVWDFEDQLQQVDLGGGGMAYYVYDASGQRVRKVIESQNGIRQKERIYIGDFEIYHEFNGNGVAKTLERESLHIMDDQQRIALVETQTVEQGNLVNNPIPLQRYQLGNHLGSASVELDKDGALISYEEYHPYGTTAFQAGRNAAEVSLKRYRYTGKERDEESGLYYHGARYYVPWLGRWVSCDPIVVTFNLKEVEPGGGFAALSCLYSAMRENPIQYVDRAGKSPELWKKIRQVSALLMHLFREDVTKYEHIVIKPQRITPGHEQIQRVGEQLKPEMASRWLPPQRGYPPMPPFPKVEPRTTFELVNRKSIEYSLKNAAQKAEFERILEEKVGQYASGGGGAAASGVAGLMRLLGWIGMVFTVHQALKEEQRNYYARQDIERQTKVEERLMWIERYYRLALSERARLGGSGPTEREINILKGGTPLIMREEAEAIMRREKMASLLKEFKNVLSGKTLHE
jgi:RHS repeat-associated protein